MALNAFISDHGKDNIMIITISLDSSVEKLAEFLDSNAIDLPVICDYNYWDSELAGRYAIKRIPSTILTNKAGIVIAKDIISEELMVKLKEIER